MLPTHPRGARRSEALSLWQGHRHPGAGRDGFSTPPAQGGIKIKATPRLPPAPSRSGACARKRSPAGLEPPLPPGSPGPSPVPRRFPGTLPTPVPGRGGSRVARKPLLASAPRRSPPPAPLPHLARRSRAGWPPGRPARGAPRCAAGIPVPARSGPPCPPAPSPWPERGAPLPGGAQAARGAAPLAGGGQRHSMAGRGGARSAAERCFPEGCEARRGEARHGTARRGWARLGSARHGCLQPATRGAGTGGGRAGPGWGEGLRRPPAIKCEQEPRSEPRGKGGGGGWEPPAADRPPPPAPLRGWRGAHWRSQPAPRCPPGWGTRRGAAPGGAVPEGASSPYPPGPSLQAGGTPAPPLGPQMLSPAPPKCSPLPPAFAAPPADLAQRGGSARSWGSLLGRGSLGFYRCPGARVGLGFLSLTCFSLLQSPGRW